MNWEVIYYESEDGSCSIEDFIESRSQKQQEKIFSWIGLLQKHGPSLPRPYADFLRDGIHELRIKLSGDQVRVLYFFCFRTKIVLTHHFIKRTKKVPKAEIEKALACMENFKSRFKEEGAG